MKKLITFLMAIVLTFCLFGCDSCNEETVGKNDPNLKDSTSVFASVKEGDFTYSITRGEMYLNLKKDTGTTSLMTIIDKYILEKEKNENDKTYYEAVTIEEIQELIDTDVYGDDKDSLTTEEKTEKEADFLETMFASYGIDVTSIYDDKVAEQYRLSLAEKHYAAKILKDEIKENDKAYAEYEALTEEEKEAAEDPVTSPYYTDSQYETLYNNDNYNTYKAIVIPFTTEIIAKAALEQIGVTVNNDGVWADGAGNALTAIAVLEKYIDLYELVYGYKASALTATSEEFDYTETELSSLNSNVLARVKKMASYTTESTNVDPDWYYATPYVTSSGSLYAYILKLDQNDAKLFADLTDEELTAVKAQYVADLEESSLTSTYIMTKMAELRNEYNLKIYDTIIEASYADVVSGYSVEFNTTTEEKENIVASIDGLEVTCEDLFAEMERLSGQATLVDLLVSKRFLINSDLNKYYNYATKEWLDTDKSEELDETVASEKSSFESGSYVDYGYDPSVISWKTFLIMNYGVETEEEFKLLLLSQTVISDFTDALNFLETYEENSEGVNVFDKEVSDPEVVALWEQITSAMQATVDEYFSVEGIHFLICAYENVTDYISGNSGLDPEEWTTEQNTKALELYAEIKAYLNDSKGTYQEKFEKIVTAYKAAPVSDTATTVAGTENITVLVSDGGNATIHLSQFKSYGLYVKWENLGTFTNGSMVETFNDAVKDIWDADMVTHTTDKVTVATEAIKTEYGYHLYINLGSKELSYIEKTSETSGTTYRYLPTLEEVRKYVTDEDLTTSVETAITTYYVPYQTEIVGDYFTSAVQYNALKSIISSLDSQGSSDEVQIDKYLGLYLDYTFETYLTKVTKEFLNTIK